jgi:hypothetical protein
MRRSTSPSERRASGGKRSLFRGARRATARAHRLAFLGRPFRACLSACFNPGRGPGPGVSTFQPAEPAAYCSPQRELWVVQGRRKARECGRHSQFVSKWVKVRGIAAFHQPSTDQRAVPRVRTSMSPPTRASLVRNANPQLTLWAKICRRLRRLKCRNSRPRALPWADIARPVGAEPGRQRPVRLSPEGQRPGPCQPRATPWVNHAEKQALKGRPKSNERKLA